SLQRLGSILRSFFRFLVLTGRCRQTQVPGIPAIRTGGRPSLPDYLSCQELARLLGAFDRRTKQGLRDYAVILCSAKLGLRAGEVAGIFLEDIDWRAGTLSLRQTKGRRSRLLPLLPEVGKALSDYVQQARPATVHRQVFVGRDGQRVVLSATISAVTQK